MPTWEAASVVVRARKKRNAPLGSTNISPSISWRLCGSAKTRKTCRRDDFAQPFFTRLSVVPSLVLNAVVTLGTGVSVSSDPD
jgi:hypothetical protein